MDNTTMNTSIGVCLGASTISAVRVHSHQDECTIDKVLLRSHEGNPKSAFQAVLDEIGCDGAPVFITGRKFKHLVQFPTLTEPEAIEYALGYLQQQNGQAPYNTIISAGGETFLVYRLDEKNRIVDIQTGNKCASGTGEFFIQQIKRMGLSIEEAMKLQGQEGFFKVSGRCSVFCKSDCTHALNKGEPIGNIVNGLCRMIAEKILELLAKFQQNRIMLIGGLSRNAGVVKYLKQQIDDVYIPEYAPYFEAFGAALAAAKATSADLPTELFHHKSSSFTFLDPLVKASHLVTFHEARIGAPRENDRCIIGLDVGSTTTKAVLVRMADNQVLASRYLRTNGNPVEASRACYQSILDQLGDIRVNIVAIGVTGSGRRIAGLYSLTDGVINEIIAHATGAIYYDAGVDTIFEIGGQDAKYTFITNSVASDYAMNEACSAGTGSFLEEAAFESLGVDVEAIADLALQGDRPPNFNDQCAAFIASDIKTALHEGISREDILAGLVYSIALNYINRVKGHREVGTTVFMQGGVCYNRAVPLAMAAIVGKKIVVPPEPGLIGAFGVALEVKKRLELGLMEEQAHDLETLVNRQVLYESPFICKGGKERCDLKCQINRIRIEGKLYPFGGACDRYYSHLQHAGEHEDGLDLVAFRNSLTFQKYAPALSPSPEAPVVGISTSFLAHRLFPLYANFFAQLGCKVIVPDGVVEEAFYRQTTSMCFPAQLALGLFENLLNKNPDYVFMPQISQMYVPNGDTRPEFSSTCLLVRGEPYWIRQAFPEQHLEERLICPQLNFSKGWEEGQEVFVAIARQLGRTRAEALKAFEAALATHRDFEQECQERGSQFVEELEQHPDQIGVVLFGRPYNAYTPLANKGIPRKIASHGYPVIPFEMLPYHDEPLDPAFGYRMPWESGQRILRVAQMVKRHKQLFGVYITNFSCGPDSFLLSYFRRLMGTKPCLTLELDSHTADAGINTRLEAFFDIVKNSLEVRHSVPAETTNHYRPAAIITRKNKRYYQDSGGEIRSFQDPSVTMVLPNMGDLSTEAMAIAFRRSGIKTRVLPIPDHTTLQFGRSVATGKECLPFLVCVGLTLQYLESHHNPDERLIVFLPDAAGFCRLGQYQVFTKIILQEKQAENVGVFTLFLNNGFTGLGLPFMWTAWQGILISDLLTDIRHALWALAVDPEDAEARFDTECEHIFAALAGTSPVSLYEQLRRSALKLREIPLKQPYAEAPKVIVTGEIFVRREPFSNMFIAKRLAEKGFVVEISPVAEFMRYTNFLIKNKLKPARMGLKNSLELFVLDHTEQFIERKIKNLLGLSGLCATETIDVADIIRHCEHLFPRNLHGEFSLTAGMMLRDALTHYCGIINIGPFGCMQLRLAEGVLSPQATVKGIKESYQQAGKRLNLTAFEDNEKFPFLTIEADGNPFPQLLEARFEHFCLQASRVAERMRK